MSETVEEFSLYAPVGNHYGTIYVRRDEEGKTFLCIDDWNALREVEVSHDFFDAFVKEFCKVKTI